MAAVGIAADARGERAMELDVVDGQTVDPTERVVTGTEAVDAQLEAGSDPGGQFEEGLSLFAHDDFGNFDGQTPGRDGVVVGQARERDVEGVVGELSRRQVEHHDIVVLRVADEGVELLVNPFEHEAPEGAHEATVFGRGHHLDGAQADLPAEA